MSDQLTSHGATMKQTTVVNPSTVRMVGRRLAVIGLMAGVGGTSTDALVKAEIHETQKLKVAFSNRDTNRISIDNSRVAQVFGVEDLLAIQFDEENGQCFVKAKVTPPHPVTLTLITEEGETQDLELTFVDKPSETVILHSLKKDLQPLSDVVGEGEDAVKLQAVELIKQLVRHHIPKGFSVVALSSKAEATLHNGSVVNYHQRLTGGGFDVLIGVVQNPTSQRLRIQAPSIAGERDVALYLSAWEVHPQGSASFVIVRQRG